MKLKTSFLLFAALSGIVAGHAPSAFALAIVFDEFGNITIDGVAGTKGQTAQYSQTFTLRYQLPANAAEGVIFLYEGDDESNRTDAMVFTGFDQMYVFSDSPLGDPGEPGNLADSPVEYWPALSLNRLFIPEVGPEGNNSATYTPTSTQPGYIIGEDVTYTFVSDGVVPEPSSILLTALGAGILLWQYRLMNKLYEASQARISTLERR